MNSKPVKSIICVILITITLPILPSEWSYRFGLAEKNTTDHFGDETFSENIHTVLLRSTTWEFSSPVLELGSAQRLELLFDDLSGNQHTFIYTLVHCDANWDRSELQPQEYLSGMGQGTIRESAPSINTTYGFIHYRLEFPEEECLPVISGNYVVEVSDADEPDKIVLTRKFYVIEKAVQITGKVKQPPPGDFRETGQQIDMTVKLGNLTISDPLHDLVAVILQNGREDGMLRNLKPSFLSQDRIEYSNPDEGIFPGGNEFRTLDIKSMKYQTENIASIEFQNPYYHVYLKPDKNRENKPYFSKTDLNGNFFINKEKAREKHLEADYVYVHFCLEESFPLEEDVFVFGKLTGWKCAGTNKMEYNAAKNCYEAVLLLKQGLYDYDFAVLEKSPGNTNEEIFEGSYYETGNDYEIYIYLHDIHGGYDRLIGYLPLKK